MKHVCEWMLITSRVVNWLMRRLLTYNNQIHQSFAALPRLQLSLDVDGLPGLPGAARCGSCGEVVPI